MSYPHYSADCDQHHDLVRDFGGPRPAIVVLCGSTRFYDTFRAENLRLTLAGKIVLSIGCDTKADGDIAEIGDLGQAKADLDNLHKRKIDLADEVLVLNVGGYIGDSTRGEIEYAIKAVKPVRYLEDGARRLLTDEEIHTSFLSSEEWKDSRTDRAARIYDAQSGGPR